MRAPSTDLLRVLRLATIPLPPSSVPRPVCLSARRIPQSSSLSPHRTLHASSRVLAASEGSRTTSKGTTATINTTSGTSNRGAARPSFRAHPINPRAPKTHDRGPVSEEDTQTDFAKMDILATAGAATPATAIDACIHDGFYLNNGVQTSGGLGVLLLDGEAFVWAPWNGSSITGTNDTDDKTNTNTNTRGGSDGSTTAGFGKFLDRRGILTLPPSSLGIFELVYPKPDLLIIGTGRKLWMLGRETRQYLSEQLGIKVDIMDTANAAAAYNLLATERGVTEVAGLMIPDGFMGL
ncbi:hypothetical protein A1O3_04100 [Capronia epimyces CBS 606.96]|uniref:NADH dehydrogenase [ubiquinone] 1 alpha subcomplex assembly factor 3 n=1 Tax=Capronia epimyces CBS 606.96 TaxID=1182542 RepID=W9Y2V5_9EURO|nr:uncharacterized protein A1O3_04100 [Capronia epimyces CBS 606.96]EXJ87142.1 hypothetical protein A1O3_04100 [Capronia epimyces CBS 606.96]